MRDSVCEGFGVWGLKKRGQQEIVGFVLIVVVVMIALMVFLIISVRDSAEDGDSVKGSNMIDVIMATTSECAIVYEPDYDSYEDLIKSCHKGNSCSNLDRTACDYLNESLGDVVEALMESEGAVGGWTLELFVKDGEGILKWEGGNCSGGFDGAQRSIISGSTSLAIRMRICGLS